MASDALTVPGARLEIGQPDIIGPSIAAHRCVVAAMIIGAVDQEAANASGAHFGEGDFLAGKSGHALLKRGRAARAIRWPKIRAFLEGWGGPGPGRRGGNSIKPCQSSLTGNLTFLRKLRSDFGVR